MPFQIIRNDIIKVKADAIVNTANPDPVIGGGVDQAIYTAAGAEELLTERQKIGAIRPGEAAVTGAFNLPARFIIHTVGPVWQDGLHGEPETLASCYRKSLLLAKQLGCESIAFPLISTGVYGFPKALALQIALREIEAFLQDSDMEVLLVVFSKEAFDLSSELAEDVKAFIDDRYVEKRKVEEYGSPYDEALDRRRRQVWSDQVVSQSVMPPYFREEAVSYQAAQAAPKPQMTASVKEKKKFSFNHKKNETAKSDLPDIVKHPAESFQERLLHLIDERGLTDAEVYKKANVDRKLFSKIRCNPDYCPRKRTALALAVALKLDLQETSDLLMRGGMALSPSSKFDLIVEYCIRKRIYDIFEINALLFQYDQPLLGL